MLGAIKRIPLLCRPVQDREDLRALEHVDLEGFHCESRVTSPTVAAAVGFAKLVMMSGIGLSSGTLCTCSFWRNVITSRGVLSPEV